MRLSQLKSFLAKTMVIAGGETPLRFRTIAELVSSHIPDCKLTIVPGAGHMSPGSHPEDIAAAIGAHLNAATQEVGDL